MSEEVNKIDYRGAYFKGLKGLSSKTREEWSKNYLNELQGLNEDEQDNLFRNKLFTEQYSNSNDPKDQEIWNNRKSLSKTQRDVLYAQKAISNNLDGTSGIKETPFNIIDHILDPTKTYALSRAVAKHSRTLRDEADDFLTLNSEELQSTYRQQLEAMDTGTKEKLRENIHELSNQISPYYKEYRGTRKLPMTPEEETNILANFNAWQDTGGEQFALRKLSQYYQDTVAKNQSLWEKAHNTGAQFVDSAAGLLLRGIGMMGALTTIGKEEGEDYWENVIDNDLTRFADRIATTNSYDSEEQLRLEGSGLSDNPILNSVAQQNQLLSANTPFELLGQYGFTAGSTLASFGGTALVTGAVKGAGWVAKSALVGKGLNSTARGIQIAKGLIKAKDIGNLLVVGGVAAVEGGMNAAQTRNTKLDAFNQDIEQRWSEKAKGEIAEFVQSDPVAAMQLLKSKGYDLPEDAVVNEENIKMLTEALQSEPDVVNAHLAKYEQAITEEKIKAEEDAKSAMYVDFIGNSIINGFVNSTLQASLNAPSIQRTLRKYGMSKSPFAKTGVEIAGDTEKGWKAVAKKYTKGQAFKSRLKESYGEGIEEYTQDLSSGFAQGYADDKMKQYIDYKYGETEGADAFEEDVTRSLVAGLTTLGEKAVSKEAIKAGVYGALSTFLGGANVNSNILNGTRGTTKKLDKESTWDRIRRVSPIEWRSGITPLFSGKETTAVNEHREKLAQNVNDFFANKEAQDLFFNLQASTNWMTHAQKAAESGDEKELRDAKFGTMMSNVATLNSLKGTAYYDAVMASLNQRVNFKEENLQNPESTEFKAVEQYKNSIPNRASEITDQQALTEIKKSSQELLNTSKKVDTEVQAVEKLFGESLDKDVKEAIAFQRLAIQDSKSRMDKIDTEMNQVKSAITKESTTVEDSRLGVSAKKAMVRFGSLGAATRELNQIKAERKEKEDLLHDIKQELKVKKLDPKERKKLLGLRDILIMEVSQAKSIEEESEKAIEDYRNVAKTRTETKVDEKGNEVTTQVTEGSEVLSANDIMNLNPMDRAFMMNPKNKSVYSNEQQAEIDRVRSIGLQVYQDFDNKVVDRGSLEQSYERATRMQLALMENPGVFRAYASNVKAQKQKKLLEKKYSYFNDYKEGDYATFAQELDRITTSAPTNERNAALSVVSKSMNPEVQTLWKKYNDSREKIKDVYSNISKNQAFTKLNDNEKGMFGHTVAYLESKEVDFNDKAAVTNALIAQDQEGKSEFEKYINTVNSELEENAKVAFTSIPEAIQNFNDVIGEYTTTKAQAESNTKKVETSPTKTEDNAPPASPLPGVFATQATSSVDMEATTDGTKKPVTSVEVEKPVEKEVTTPVSNPVIEKYKINSGEKVAEAAELAFKIVENTTTNHYAKLMVKYELERLSENDFDNIEEFAGALLQGANRLDIKGDNQAAFQAAGLLRQLSARLQVKAQKDKASVSSPTTSSDFTDRKKQEPNAGRPVNPLSHEMESLDLVEQRQKYPDSPVTKFLERYKVSEFLNNSANITRDTPVMFLTDTQLAEEVKADLESKGFNYNEDNMPLVAVVEVPSGGISITENGVEKHYQPIGIMPRAQEKDKSGVNRLSEIRKNITNQPLGQLIKDKEGKTIKTKLAKAVEAQQPRHLQKGVEDNRSAVNLGISDLNEQERDTLQSLPKSDRRKSPLYWKIKQAFLNKLTVIRIPGQKPRMGYKIDYLKGNPDTNAPYDVFDVPLIRSYDKNSDRLITDVFRENDVEAGLIANSRIKRYAQELYKIFEGFNTSEMGFLNGAPTEATQDILNKTEALLDRELKDYIILPQNIRYVLTPVMVQDTEGNSVIKQLPDGRPMFALSVVDTVKGGEPIFLGEVTNGKMSDNTKFNIIKNLMFDENGAIRMRDNKHGLIKWNISYANIESDVKAAKDDISDIYDDDLFELSKNSLQYQVHKVILESPFRENGSPIYGKVPVETNADNATTPPLNSPVDPDAVITPGGAVVDISTGTVIQGTIPPPVKFNTEAETREEVQPNPIQSEEADTPLVDPILGLPVFSMDMWGDNSTGSTPPSSKDKFIPAELEWGVWLNATDLNGNPLDIEATKKNLEATGVTEESWKDLTEDEMQHELKCKGVGRA